MENREPKFLKIGKRWINIGSGNITDAEETLDFDGKICIEIRFVGDTAIRIYNGRLDMDRELDAMRWWLNKYSGEPIMDTYKLFVKHEREK
jgi:hypothetical protein